ncbi:MAG: M12 family metallo-peptidase, partial [Cyanobium sp.]
MAQRLLTSTELSSALQASHSVSNLGISIEILDDANFSGNKDACSIVLPNESKHIQLNRAGRQVVTTAEIEAPLLKQIGPAIDDKLKTAADTAGDEGAIFSAQLRRETPDSPAYNENDKSFIILPESRSEQPRSDAAASLVHDLLGAGLAAAEPTVCRCPACSRLFVGDTSTSTGASLATAALDISLTFKLHSNPTANQRIYLDFNGYYLANSAWENGATLQVGAFYSSMGSDAAQQAIQEIWRRVAEDFAPFNIDVTTEEPNSDDLKKSDAGDTRWGIRVAMTTNANLVTNAAIKNAGGGGTAYLGSFNWATDEVCLVFNGYNDTSAAAVYAAAETASHEVGHTLGLSHDGNSYNNYYEGHGSGDTSWGPIMGSPFINTDKNVTTWSKGDYFDANNQEDDLGIITGSISNAYVSGNGFTYRVDDYGDSLATAYTLSGTAPSCFGIIERSTDVDWFRFSTGNASVSLNIRNACQVFTANGDGTFNTQYLDSVGPNLNISAQLFDANGVLIATSNPLDRLDASFSLSLSEGDYYLSVEGVGFGTPYANPPSGYTDYGSLGQYLITTTVLAGDNIAPILTGITVQDNQLLLQFSEAIVTTGLLSSRFGISVAGVATAVSAIGAGGDNTQLLLTLSGTAPTSAQTVTLSYTDLTIGNDSSGVIQDLAGNDLATISPTRNADTFSSSANVTTLAATYSNLILRGTASSGTGNSGNNNIRVQQSTAVANLLTGGFGTDSIDGGEGSDIYVIASSLDHPAAEISDSGASGTDELRFSSTTAGQTLIIYAADTGLERVTIGSGSAAAAVLTGTTALNVDASAAANGLMITGNAGANVIIGSGFVDSLDGRDGSDLYVIST